MAGVGQTAEKQIQEITKCSICLSTFTDPRMLPCIHTFCFECLNRTGEVAQMKPGDKLPCPLCRKELTIPTDGMSGVQKNFFIENLVEFKNRMRLDSPAIMCDICSERDEGETATATTRCLDCQENYCNICLKVHQFQKLSRHHRMAKIGGDTGSEMNRPHATKCCSKHTQKPLDYYCSDCKIIVCVSCFVESHKTHDCKDVTTVFEEFRQTIEKHAWKISGYADGYSCMRKNKETKRADFLKDVIEKEEEIHRRNQELKVMIDEHTKSLLDELCVVKSNQIKAMEMEIDEIERHWTMLKSFEIYCTELVSKGSVSDICSSFDQLIRGADDFEREYEAFIGLPLQSIEVSIETTDLKDVLQKSNNNIVGQLKETTTQFENYAVVVGLPGRLGTTDVVKINLHRPNEISVHQQISYAMVLETETVVSNNTMYVTGVGCHNDEIWKYSDTSGWELLTYFVNDRCGHSVAFVDGILYICGGYVKSNARFIVTDSVEAYNTVTNRCAVVGKLVHGIGISGNCVPFRSSLYIFGGKDKDDDCISPMPLHITDENCVSHVQIYDTKQNICTVLSTQMPSPQCLMRAALWETSVILLGLDTCLIFNLETETWQERKQFKTDVIQCALVQDNERVFIIGGLIKKSSKPGNVEWKGTVDVRFVPIRNILEDKPIEWKIHGKLPVPSLLYIYAKMRFPI